MKEFTKKEKDFLNEFLLFILTKDPVIVSRILNSMIDDNKCGDAPKIALDILKLVRRKVVIKQLVNIPKNDLLTVLLDSDNKKVIGLIKDLTNEFVKVKDKNSCKIKYQSGGKGSKKICYKKKVEKVMSEFKNGKLKTSSGLKVKTRSQAIAIALNSAKRKCLLK